MRKLRPGRDSSLLQLVESVAGPLPAAAATPALPSPCSANPGSLNIQQTWEEPACSTQGSLTHWDHPTLYSFNHFPVSDPQFLSAEKRGTAPPATTPVGPCPAEAIGLCCCTSASCSCHLLCPGPPHLLFRFSSKGPTVSGNPPEDKECHLPYWLPVTPEHLYPPITARQLPLKMIQMTGNSLYFDDLFV